MIPARGSSGQKSGILPVTHRPATLERAHHIVVVDRGRTVESGRFADEITPITLKSRKGERVFDTDEHAKPSTTAEDLAKLRTVFKKDGSVTAGNSSYLTDGGAAVLLASEDAAKKLGLEPVATLRSAAVAAREAAMAR